MTDEKVDGSNLSEVRIKINDFFLNSLFYSRKVIMC